MAMEYKISAVQEDGLGAIRLFLVFLSVGILWPEMAWDQDVEIFPIFSRSGISSSSGY